MRGGTDAYDLLIESAADRLGTGPAAARLAREAAVEVRRVHERRQAVEAAALVVNGSGHPEDVGSLIRHLERVQAAAADAAGGRPMSLLDCVDAWARHERTPAVPTGLGWFDGPTEGGLPVGGIVALAAYPKVGKSAFALQLTLAALVHDPELRAVWGLGEMAAHGLGRRMACVASALLPDLQPVTMRDAGRRSAEARAAGVALCVAIGDRLSIVTPPLTVEAIEARVATTGSRLVVIDYLQLMHTAERTADRVHELDAIIGRIREMAIARDCAVIVISSVAKSASTASRAGQVAKGSGEIDYAVELLYLGEREEDGRGEPVIADDGTVGVVWHCKAARNLEHRDLSLRFDGAMQIYGVDGFDEFAGFSPDASSDEHAAPYRNRGAGSPPHGRGPGGAGRLGAAPGRRASPASPSARRKGDRWAALNGFVDVIAPRLSLAERSVWTLMFRHARGWVCETSVRFVAQGAAVSRSTAEAALARLQRAGLVWPITKSRHKGSASRYGMHPDPAACLGRLLADGEPSRPSGRLADRTVPIDRGNRPDHRDKYRKQKGRRLPAGIRGPGEGEGTAPDKGTTERRVRA